MHSTGLRLFFALIIYLLLGCMTSALGADADRFEAPSGDFSVWAPAKFKKGWGDEAEDKNAARDGIERFLAVKDDGAVYMLETIPVGTDTMNDIEEEIPKKDDDYKFERPKVAKGTHWEGRRFRATKDDDKMLQLVVIEDSHSELIRLVTNDDGPEGERFLNSLAVSPDNARKRVKTHNDATMDRILHPKSINEALGIVGCILGFLGVAVSTVWLIVLGFRRNIWWGVGMIFIPIVRLAYTCMHWRESWVPFSIGIVSGIVMIVGAINFPHL